MPTDATRRSLQEALGDGYEVGRLVGRGGFAEVFLAHQKRLKRDVAVKVLRPDLVLSEGLLERFQLEAEAIARVRHPNIIDIYAVGGSEGTAFFVMPLVAGETLEERLSRQRPLPLQETMRILREAAGALAAAHDVGIIHRDIKPANLLLEEPHGRLLVTDFGIAKAMQEGGDPETESGILVGTPQYMSPEQATGDPVDHRSDIYSLGVVAYEMVTGRLPFEGDSSRQVILKHITEAPEPVRSRRSDCPEGLARVIERCLEKESEERVQEAADIVEALAPGAGVVASGLSGVSRAGQSPEPIRRFRRTVLMAGGVAVAAPLMEVALTGQVAVSLLLWAVAFFLVAVRYGRLWSAGYSLRAALDVRMRSTSSTPSATLQPQGSGSGFEAFGAHNGIVRECRAERARIVLLFQELSRVEQTRLAILVRVVDQLLAGVRRVARQLAALEGRVDFEELAVARAAGSAEVGYLGHDTTVTELETARGEKALELRSCVERLGEVRRLLERSTAGDPIEELEALILSLGATEEVC